VEQNLQKLFKQASFQPESRLSGDILLSIEVKSSRIAKWKTIGYMSVSVLSLSLSVLSIKSVIEQFTTTGFYNYLSLAFSDSGVIATYWKEYILSLADSLPIMSIILSFSLLFILFISIKKVSHQFRNKLLIA